jgi:hypothetical protein
MGRGSEGKDRIIRDHGLGDHKAISGQIKAISGQIKAMIAFMVVGITEKDNTQRAEQAYEVLWLTLWGSRHSQKHEDARKWGLYRIE